MLSVGKSVLCPDCAFILTLKFPYKTLSSVEVRDTLPAVETHTQKALLEPCWSPTGALLEPFWSPFGGFLEVFWSPAGALVFIALCFQ